MSGGSFNYLYGQYLDEKASTIEEMAEWLHDLGQHEAAAETERVAGMLRRADELRGNLSDVWQAVEWYRSADYSREQAQEAATRWVVENPLDLNRADISKRLYELEKEVSELRSRLAKP